MDTFAHELLKELKALRGAVDAARAEAASHHVEIVQHLDKVRERLDRIDDRFAAMEIMLTASLPKLATESLVAALRAAMLGAA